MKTNTLFIYYGLLALILTGRVVSTVFNGSVAIHHAQQVAELQREKQELLREKSTLRHSLLSSNSLTSVVSSLEITDFEAISRPLVVGSQHSFVASSSL